MALVPVCARGQSIKDTLMINEPDGEYPINRHLHIYGTDRRLSPDFIAGSLAPSAFTTLFPEKSFSARLKVYKYYWLQVTVKNNLPKVDFFYFQLNSQTLDVVTAYQENPGGHFTTLGITGTDIPFKLRAYRYCDLVFPVMLKPGEVIHLLLRIDNNDPNDGDDIHFLPQFSASNIFKAEEEKFYIVTGLITGVMLTVFLLNIFIGFALKEKIHLYYGLYILVALYEIYSISGTDLQYIYPQRPEFSGYLQYLSPCLLAILMTMIMQFFLDQRKTNSKIKRYADIGFWAIIGMMLVNLFIFFAFPENRSLIGVYEIVLAVLLLFQCLVFVASAVEKILQGFKPSWFYLAAITVFIIGLIEFIVMVLFGSNQELVLKRYPNDLQIGIVVEAIVVFLGIAYRYNLYKKEKERLMIELSIQQRNLIEKIVEAEETERKRIAEDLHDDVGATLSILSMHLSNVPKGTGGESHEQQSLNLSVKAFNDIRAIAHNLLPRDFTETGLFLTLEARVYELNTTGPIRFVLITEGDEKKLNELFSITIYRIVNELLINIRKHSMAAEAAVQVLLTENNVQIMTEDDGIGFKSDSVMSGIGLKNIKGRVELLNGTIHIDSSKNGTQTIIHIPLT
ncbi:sensor histidine kinase [Mucilaginibacter corticis]|nr:7TM diverse intracellular signaling domain-containing protein [Mucilaginibacter corticis]